jgi:HNH endonuclease
VTNSSPLVRCIYCDRDVAQGALTDEHIWPDALGGDALPTFWRTEVCGACNSTSGVYVDGAFIKSWVGAAERATGDKAHLATNAPERAVVPFSYIGTLPDIGAVEGEIVDYWVGRCGSSVLHFRPENDVDLWSSYAGGDPRKGSKRKTAGRAYLAILSPVPFWQLVALNSFRAQFKKAQRFRSTVLDATVTTDLPIPDENDPVQKRDIAVLHHVLSGQKLRANSAIDPALGTRFQAKLGLALGYRLFGDAFGKTGYARALRAAFREADPAKQQSSIVRGTGILASEGLGGAENVMRWRGGWLLWMRRLGTDTALIVISPSAKVMTVVVNNDAALTNSLGPEYDDGVVWVTVPSIQEAVGPVPAPDYVAHQIGEIRQSDLAALEAKRTCSASLPDCGLGD